MKSYNKTIILTALLLVVAGNFSSCEKEKEIAIDWSKIDLSNIENLHEQPLPVIQKCVEGKWQWILLSTWGFLGEIHLNNTFVNITKDSVVITQEGYEMANLKGTFIYRWIKKKTLSEYTTYVIWNNKKNRGEWFFDTIHNDTLVVLSDYANTGGFSDMCFFLRVK